MKLFFKLEAIYRVPQKSVSYDGRDRHSKGRQGSVAKNMFVIKTYLRFYTKHRYVLKQTIFCNRPQLYFRQCCPLNVVDNSRRQVACGQHFIQRDRLKAMTDIATELSCLKIG